MDGSKRIERALLSVSDKTGIVEFARHACSFGTKIISTGGTASALRNAGIDVTDVSDVTGFPEMMGGRVKTLHPKIHGGILALRDDQEHVEAMTAHGIDAIDLVVINLYPFEKTVADPEVSLEDAVENIDIGGPAMIRSAAKNWRCRRRHRPALYESVAGELTQNDGSLSLAARQRLAVLAYTRTAAYDLSISSYLAGQLSEADLEQLEPHNPLGGLMFIESEELAVEDAADPPEIAEADESESFPHDLRLHFAKIADLRYGENPHQKAALYSSGGEAGIAGAEQLHGKEMSFNNFVDADAALSLVREFEGPAAAIIKHSNPSGVGTGGSLEEAYGRALSTDPVSAFGGIVALNRKVDAATAAGVIQIFTEVVLAPGFDDDALELFRSKKNLRVLRVSLHEAGEDPGRGIDSLRIAAIRAERFGLQTAGAALASDAFFPFRDSVDEAAKLGISAIIQPGGSLKDDESIAAANEHGIVMAFSGVRHFDH
ncbi:MAG: bifunctional phosphoribosylaminoimidazolecarboxamide formyltransferase/IMP cyclohydrolase [Chloracidobacterium sp.]|nr:bifunctional phosphoribosylaminoimidazolecarboxamide formyltransferase/IMP cyclohydrolase [Chloracidobacterium sp.]